MAEQPPLTQNGLHAHHTRSIQRTSAAPSSRRQATIELRNDLTQDSHHLQTPSCNRYPASAAAATIMRATISRGETEREIGPCLGHRQPYEGTDALLVRMGLVSIFLLNVISPCALILWYVSHGLTHPRDWRPDPVSSFPMVPDLAGPGTFALRPSAGQGLIALGWSCLMFPLSNLHSTRASQHHRVVNKSQPTRTESLLHDFPVRSKASRQMACGFYNETRTQIHPS
jgi:hypothetical protein